MVTAVCTKWNVDDVRQEKYVYLKLSSNKLLDIKCSIKYKLCINDNHLNVDGSVEVLTKWLLIHIMYLTMQGFDHQWNILRSIGQ